MSALSIQPTYPIFTDIDGQPLEDGYVWIGTVNLDPQTNPINVYWDAALTLPAAQPIRTLAGYPANSGTPARLYVNSDYSIRVMNKNGSVVYSAPAATERYSEAVVSSVNAANVVYEPPFTGGVQTNAEAKLAQIVSVKDFGAVGDGVTDDTAAIQAALNVGGHIIFPTGVYRCDTVLISKDTDIDFQGSTVKRLTPNTSRIFESSAPGNLTMRNGTIDGDNTPANRGMLLQYNDSNGTLVLENMTWQNNCKFDAPNDPAKSQDTDLVYVLNAASVEVDNCRFKLASRQGISFVGVCPYSSITNSTFEDCYLFGVDYEPNTPTTHMYEEIVVNGCVFKNNGSKNPVAGNYVWNSGGAMLVGSGTPGVQFARNITFSNNQIISTDFLNAEVAWVEPYLRFDQYQTINFTGNLVDNLGFVNFGAFTTIDIEESVIVGNTFKVTGNQENSISFNKSLRNIVNDNILTRVFCKDGTFIISGNDFTQPGMAEAINLSATCLDTTITGNIFDNKTTVVNASAMTNSWTFNSNFVGINFTTLYTGAPRDQAGNKVTSANLGNVTNRSSASFLPISVVANDINYAAGRGAGHRFDIGFDTPKTKVFGGALIGAVNVGGSGSGNADFVVQVALSEVLTERVRVQGFDGAFRPSADGTQQLGTAGFRWSEVFAVAPAINTSDEREKQRVVNINDAERRVAIAIKSKLCKFKFNDAVNKKGDGARWHFGVLAQDIARAFEAEGLDARAYGMFCHDTWEAQEEVLDEEGNIINHAREAGDRYGVRYEELFAFVLAAI